MKIIRSVNKIQFIFLFINERYFGFDLYFAFILPKLIIKARFGASVKTSYDF